MGGRDERGGSEQPERDSGGAGVEEANQRGVAGDAAVRDGDDGTVRHESRRRVYQRQDHQALSPLAPAGHRRHVVPVRQESGESRALHAPPTAVKCRYPGFISLVRIAPFLAPLVSRRPHYGGENAEAPRDHRHTFGTAFDMRSLICSARFVCQKFWIKKNRIPIGAIVKR